MARATAPRAGPRGHTHQRHRLVRGRRQHHTHDPSAATVGVLPSHASRPSDRSIGGQQRSSGKRPAPNRPQPARPPVGPPEHLRLCTSDEQLAISGGQQSNAAVGRSTVGGTGGIVAALLQPWRHCGGIVDEHRCMRMHFQVRGGMCVLNAVHQGWKLLN